MDPVFAACLEKIAESTTASHEDLLPTTFKGLRKKQSMIHPSMQEVSETMSPAKWKQTAKDVPLSILAGGLGYGIGRTLAEVIGDRVATGGRPAWMKAVPAVMAGVSMAGAYAASRSRDGLKRRREEADQ